MNVDKDQLKSYQAVMNICCGCTAFPWIIVFFIFAYGNMDPMNCWVAEGELWVSAEATGTPGERDVGAKWRIFYKFALWVHIWLSFFVF